MAAARAIRRAEGRWVPITLRPCGMQQPAPVGAMHFDAFGVAQLSSGVHKQGYGDVDFLGLRAANAFHHLAERPPGSDASKLARGVYVRSMQAVSLSGISICDHPKVGSPEWWASGVANRRAQRAGQTLVGWLAANNILPPQPANLLAGTDPAIVAWATAAHGRRSRVRGRSTSEVDVGTKFHPLSCRDHYLRSKLEL